MKSMLVIWGIIFGITLVLVIVFSKKEFKKLISAESGKKQWKLIGDRTNYYRGMILVSFLLSAGIAYLIKYFFNL